MFIYLKCKMLHLQINNDGLTIVFFFLFQLNTLIAIVHKKLLNISVQFIEGKHVTSIMFLSCQYLQSLSDNVASSL